MDFAAIRDCVKKTEQCDPKKLNRHLIIYIDISSTDRVTKQITEPQFIPVGEAPSRARKRIQKDDFLVSTVHLNLNSVAILPKRYDNQIASTGFCVLRANTKEIDPVYLFYYSQTN